MEWPIPSFLWTFIYIVAGSYVLMRVFALILQFVVRKKTGILVKIGRVGLGSFHRIHIELKKGLHVEIDRVWLSSCYFSEGIRQPMVLCMGDVRIQASTLGPRDAGPPAPKLKTATKQFALPKFASYLQHFGLKIQSLTVMLLKTMIPDCLIHMEGHELGLDISYMDDSLQFIINAGNINCRALRSVSEGEAKRQNQEPCLAEMKFSLYIDLSLFAYNMTRVKSSRVLVNKPQLMVTEGLLSGVQSLQNIKQQDRGSQDLVSQSGDAGDRTTLLDDLPQEIGLDFTDVDVKIVRETKQRYLGVSIKTFHVEMYNQHLENNAQKVTLTLALKDFSTKSQQARCVDMVSLELKGMVFNDDIQLKLASEGAHLHYHHEEVQYWVQVIYQLTHGTSEDNTNTLQPIIQQPQETRQSGNKLVGFLREKRFTFELELIETSMTVASASCGGLIFAVNRAYKLTTLKPGLHAQGTAGMSWLQSHDLSCELEVDTLYCTHADAQQPVSNLSGQKHFWNHVLYMNILMVKIKKLGEEIRVEGMQDHLHIEWSTNTINVVISLLSTIARARLPAGRRLSDAAFRPVTKYNIPVEDEARQGTTLLKQLFRMKFDRHVNVKPITRYNIPVETEERLGTSLLKQLVKVKFDITNTNAFVCNNNEVGLMLRLDSVTLDYRQTVAGLTLEGFKVAYVRIEDQCITLLRSVDIDQPTVSVREIRIKLKQLEKEVTFTITKEMMLDWTTACHMCIIQAIEDVKEIKNKLSGETQAGDPVKIQNIPMKTGPSLKLAVNVIVATTVNLKLRLSSKHSVTLCTDSIVMSLTPSEVLMELEKLDIFCDEEKVFRFQGFLFGTMANSALSTEREEFKTLTLPTNRAWKFTIEELLIQFPFGFNFAAVFEEFVNFTKWVKLVHKVKKKTFTVDSKLPPDLQIKVKAFKLEISDNPFEVKLSDNYELLKDEYNEGQKRRAVLDQKVHALKQGYKIIPTHKLEEVYAQLDKSSSDIYIQRCKQLYQITPPRTKLFTWVMESVEIVALADTSIHGKENVVKTMREIDTDSAYPDEGLEFITLWCRFINFGVQAWTFQFRDYPQHAMEIRDMTVWGRLIGAEIEGAKRAKRTATVEVELPWGNTTVQRNLPALKFFHDFSCDVESFEIAYGACWEPFLAQYNLAFDLINKPSVDPSRPLPWWDKSRLLLHGRLVMTTNRMSWLYHASFDPYNTTEFMDWTWSNLIMDWTNGKFVLRGDLDVFARTASKYDDCRMLHLPGLKFCAKIDWLCHGDPNDHHMVMPCAPDKVPDYSHEEHDSFRAFRSQNLNLSISLETSSKKKREHPSCLFYASSLRFLDKIKMCLATVTRPIKRGKLFQNTKRRKLQLSRHYNFAKLSVNFHQFRVNYWMSFAMQHGLELSGNSFVLELKSDLALVPVTDGLAHRPNAVWSVDYLSCELLDSKIWLCSSPHKHERELDLSVSGEPVKSFFLSVSKVTYHRSSSEKQTEIAHETPEKISSEKDSPTHNLYVYEMRGSWNKENRTVLVGLYDGYQKAQAQKRNLSSEALKGFKVEEGAAANMKSAPKGLNLSLDTDTAATPSPTTKIQTGHAHNMLMKLVAESDSKSVAFTEEPSSENMDQLHGIAACQTDDVRQRNWLSFTFRMPKRDNSAGKGFATLVSEIILSNCYPVELRNSQMIVKGCETQGFVIVAMAKARILSCTHNPVWWHNQLKSKDSWVGSVECMQVDAIQMGTHNKCLYKEVNKKYTGCNLKTTALLDYTLILYYATVDASPEFDDDSIPWLSTTHVEDRPDPEQSSLQEMTASGHSVGGIVDVSASRNNVPYTIQLQRIISRCKCQFFYANYGEVDPDTGADVPLPPPSEESVLMKREEGIDTFTLLHHDLNVCTNNLQYVMILDIVNNLLLHVELKKKEATEKLQSMRFQLQLSRVEDQKTPILQLQEKMRKQMALFRQYERDLFLVLRSMEEEEEEENEMDSFSSDLLREKESLENKLLACKEKINILNDELTIRISCFKESQLQDQTQLQANKQTQQAHVIRRNEVCFKFAQWRLTEADGQVGLADVAQRNFVYTKVNRDDDTWSHQVELGWVKMTNLLPTTPYKDVLVPRDPLGKDDNRRMTLRLVCSERPPVGGIAVKEHLEVNIIPLQIQLTYHFFKKMMEFFFPDKNIDNDDQDYEVEGAAASKSGGTKQEKKNSQKKEVKRLPTASASDDIDKMKRKTMKRVSSVSMDGSMYIDKMKERAANNNTFLYVKVPEVLARVSYKGEKEKNIEDVHDFSLVLPTLEYHNQIWTWFDLLMAMKNDSKKVLLSQAIKQKLHMRSRMGEEPPVTDVQQEEDKAKMLLGAKLLGVQEKPAKKTLFGKSQK